MSFSEFFMQSRIQAIESTLQQVCAYLDQIQYNQSFNNSLYCQIQQPIISQNDDTILCIWSSIGVLIKIIMIIGLTIICFIDFFKTSLYKNNKDTFYEIVIDKQILNEGDDDKIENTTDDNLLGSTP